MRWLVFGIVCGLLNGCTGDGRVNDRAYVITQSQFEEMDSEAPIQAPQN